MTDTQDIEKFVKTVRPHEPSKLYKYRRMDSTGLERVFTETKVYFPDATKFNDPFETMPLVRLSRSEVKRNMFLTRLTRERFPKSDRPTRRKLARAARGRFTDEDFLRKVSSEIIATTGIYCLTEENADLLMWSHYADSHTGLCLEFDAMREGTLFWEAAKVTYQDDYPEVDLMRFHDPDELRKMHLTKSTHWEHEQEWRILRFENEGGPKEYPFRSELLTGVIFGARMSGNDETKLRTWVRSSAANVNLYRANLSEGRYEIEIVRVDGA